MTARRDGPLRTCIGCRAIRPQTDLLRCTIGDAGRIVVDRRAPGRGAWLCGPACLDEAARRGRFERAWRQRVDPAAIDRLRSELAASDDLTPNDHEAGGDRPRRCETERPTKG